MAGVRELIRFVGRGDSSGEASDEEPPKAKLSWSAAAGNISMTISPSPVYSSYGRTSVCIQ